MTVEVFSKIQTHENKEDGRGDIREQVTRSQASETVFSHC